MPPYPLFHLSKVASVLAAHIGRLRTELMLGRPLGF
jgi:hypothetical protein